MKTRLAFICLIAFIVCSCTGTGINVFGTDVEVVKNRRSDGTFLPTPEVTNAAGESPDASATVYHYPSGGIGVSAWYSGAGGALNGTAPKLMRK